MQISIISIAMAISVIVPLSALDMKEDIAIVHGNLTARFAASYLAPFAPEGATEPLFELIDDHEDLIQKRDGTLVSLRRRGDDCQKYHKAVRDDNCYTLSLQYNIGMSSLYEWNNQINTKCTNLYPGKKYCVKKHNESILEKTCVDSYYVKSSDNCLTVAKAHSISLDQFYDMNPSVNRDSCDNLLTGGTYCVKESMVSKHVADKVSKKKTSVKKIKTKRKKKTTTRKTTKKTTKKKSVKKSTTKKTTTKKVAHKVAKKTTIKTTIKKKTATKKTTTTKRKTTIKKTTKKPKTTAKTTKKTTITTKPTTTKVEEHKATSTSTDKRKLLQKGSALTYYWIAHPEDYDHSGKSITVKTCDGKSLGTVSQEYADALVMEGTGIVGDKVINLGGCTCKNYECFMEVDKKEDPFGLTAYGSPLRPFITIAANDIKRNTKIFVPEIEGWDIPGTSKKHNGCLLVDDQSWSFDNNHIDLYVYREKHYRTLNSEHKVNKVDIYEGGDCHLLNYS